MSGKPALRIVYCTQCNWLLRAAWMAQEVLSTFSLEIGEVTAGRLLSRLEERGWIKRRQDPRDGRQMRVHLGAGATATLHTLDQIGLSEERDALAGMPEEEVDALLRALDKVSANLGRPIDPSIAKAERE